APPPSTGRRATRRPVQPTGLAARHAANASHWLKETAMQYQKGERVALVHTDDPHTLLRPGDEGTVARHAEATATVAIDGDSGSRLSMCLDAGDRIRRLPSRDSHGGTGEVVR